ncbi:MAG: outer membrane protein assembly factor BamA [Sinobacteraceae bacterium]|nr:outer membrane protein assembly factor BamA [Nevskiaceae bacterium]
MRRKTKLPYLKPYLLILTVTLLWQVTALAFQPFTVQHIHVDGLQRLGVGTVLSYLPVAVGDQMNDSTAQQAIRSLYSSGFFDTVDLSRQGQTLVVKVKERPQIAKFKMDGNKQISGDQLKKSLKQAGLVVGKLFKRDVLDAFTHELRQQYYANGFYDVFIKTKVTPESNNRVDIHIQVGEGDAATIKSIHIVGNAAFPESKLLDQMKLKPSNSWNPFQKSDHYSRHVLLGDLEALNSYYMNRGYLRFSIPSVEVALTPDKKHVYITINVEEGDVYTVSGFGFSGNTIFNTNFVSDLVSTKKGDTFSLKKATDSSDRIESMLSNLGYAFAKVTPHPDIDEADRTVKIVYDVTPGKRVYVRHINFSGYGTTRDSTFRREMRQLEAAPFSKAAIERSRVRIARLPFVSNVTVNTTPVPGTDDQVDVNYGITQRQPGSIQLGVGYSGYQGFLISAGITHTNVFGTGDTISLNAQNSIVERAISLQFTDPYFTKDGISQTVSLFFRRDKGVIRFVSGFNTNTFGGALIYGIPLSEFTTLRLGGGISETAITSFPTFASTEVLRFVLNNGTLFHNYTLKTGISRDTRNRTFFATRGMLDMIDLDITGPGSDLLYYTAIFRHLQYIALPWNFLIRLNGDVGYTHPYGDTAGVPPWQNFFGGGPRSVRGFKAGYLDPKDSNGYPYGGTFETTLQTELVLPIPLLTNNTTTRTSVFFDIGNVFARPGDFQFNKLRQSVGIDIKWFTPVVGLLDISLGYPIKSELGDNKQIFQFTLGSAFGGGGRR